MAGDDLRQRLAELIAAHKRLQSAHKDTATHRGDGPTAEEREVHAVQLQIHIEKLREFRRQLKVERLENPKRRKNVSGGSG